MSDLNYTSRDVAMVAAGIQIAVVYIFRSVGFSVIPDDCKTQLAGIVQYAINGGKPLSGEAMQIAQSVLSDMQGVTLQAIHGKKFVRTTDGGAVQ